jgi:hypothetical protein
VLAHVGFPDLVGPPTSAATSSGLRQRFSILTSLLIMRTGMAIVMLGALFVASACTSTDEGGRDSRSMPEPSPTLRLTKERVSRDLYPGLPPDARRIRGTQTGGFKIRPRRDVRPGQRVRLEGSGWGSGCRDADSVFVTLERVLPIRPHAHDVETKHIRTVRWPTDRSGWSGWLDVPGRPRVAQYIVQAVCERAGHLFYSPTGLDFYVGESGP